MFDCQFTNIKTQKHVSIHKVPLNEDWDTCTGCCVDKYLCRAHLGQKFHYNVDNGVLTGGTVGAPTTDLGCGITCIFRRKPATDSEGKRPPIPGESGQGWSEARRGIIDQA